MPSFLRDQQLFVTILLLAIGPALIVIHPSIPFLNAGNCDPWYVFGLFYHLPDAIHWAWEGGFFHQVARLTNVIPGYLLTKAFKGISADYVMFFMFYSTSVFFFYRSVRILINDKVALFAAIFFAVHPLIIANYSVTFASPAILYCVLSLYLVARAIEAESRIGKIGFLFGSGVAMGAALHAYLGIVVYGIANYLIYFFYELFYSPKTIKARIWHLLQAGCVVFAGMAALTVALGGLAMLFGASFSLVFEQFLYLQYEFSDEAKQQWSVPDWYLHGGVAGIFLAASLLSAINIYLFNSRMKRFTLADNVRRRFLAISWAILVLTIICLAYGELDGSIIQYDYYYVFFVPYLCIVIFSPLLCLKSKESHATIVSAIVFLICALGATALNDDVLDWLHLAPIEALASVAAAICAGSIYGFLVLSDRSGPGLAALYAVSVLFMLIIVRPEQMGVQIWTSPRDLQYAREYQRIREGMALLSRVHFNTYPKFWLDMESGPSELIAYPRSYLYCNFQGQFPAIDRDLLEDGDPKFQFGPGEDVVIISGSPDLRSTASAAFAALGLVASEVADFSLASSEIHYEFLVEHISGTTVPSAADAEPPADAEEIHGAFLPIDRPESSSNDKDPFPVQVSTPAQPWAYGALFEPVREKLKGPLWIRVRADVHSGPIGIGVLNRPEDDFLSRSSVTEPGAVTIDFHVVHPELMGDLVVQSWDEAKPADITIKDITVLRPPTSIEKTSPTRKLGPLLFNVPVTRLERANGGSIFSFAEGLRLVIAAPQWSYSLRGPLPREQKTAPVVVRVRLQVEEGEVGIGVSTIGDANTFIRREDGVQASTKPQEVYLDIPDVSTADLLVIQNESSGGPSRVIVHSVEVFRPN